MDTSTEQNEIQLSKINKNINTYLRENIIGLCVFPYVNGRNTGHTDIRGQKEATTKKTIYVEKK